MLRRDQPAMTVLLGALIAVAPLAMDIYLASMPSMTRALSATTDQVQLTLSLYMYAWGCSQIFVGPLTDRFGRRPLLLAGLGLFVAASIGCAFARDIHVLIGARVVQAIGMATVAVVPRAVVRDLYTGTQAARILSLMGVVLGIAPVIAPIIGSHLHVWFGWRANFVFVSAYGAIALVCVAAALPETIPARDRRATHPAIVLANYGRLLRSRSYIGYTLVAAFASSGLFAFLAGSAFVFVAVMGTGERAFGFLFGTVMVGNILGASVGSRLVTRLGIDRMLRYSTALMLASGAMLAALSFAGAVHPLAIVAPMFLFMVALMTTMPQATAGALIAFPAIAGSAASLLLFCQFVLASTAALIVGSTFDGTQRPMAITIAVATLLAFLAFRALVRQSPRRA
jgi:DHA1 family bicyclomycin/chloramphenicol resistance-like MFS transporter